MDFGPKPEAEPKAMRKRRKIIPIVLLLALIIAGLSLLFYYSNRDNNPLPTDIQSQVSYKTVYPADKQVQTDKTHYDYEPEAKTLTFSVKSFGTNIVFTEQPAPESLGSGSQVYFPALGIHPYAQFQSKLGPVALTKFWKSGSLEPTGQTGVMVASGTLVTAHPDKDLTNDQWKQLFDSLDISR